jgi:hypothetical protein
MYHFDAEVENFNHLSKKHDAHDLGHRDGNGESDHLSPVHEDIHGAKKCSNDIRWISMEE